MSPSFLILRQAQDEERFAERRTKRSSGPFRATNAASLSERPGEERADRLPTLILRQAQDEEIGRAQEADWHPRSSS